MPSIPAVRTWILYLVESELGGEGFLRIPSSEVFNEAQVSVGGIHAQANPPRMFSVVDGVRSTVILHVRTQ